MESEILNDMNRKIVKNFLDILVLMELRKSSMSGYDVTALVQKKLGMLMSPGTVYSFLYFLERNGLIKGEWNQRKRVYRLTEKGEKTITILFEKKDKILGLVLNLFLGG